MARAFILSVLFHEGLSFRRGLSGLRVVAEHPTLDYDEIGMQFGNVPEKISPDGMVRGGGGATSCAEVPWPTARNLRG